MGFLLAIYENLWNLQQSLIGRESVKGEISYLFIFKLRGRVEFRIREVVNTEQEHCLHTRHIL